MIWAIFGTICLAILFVPLAFWLFCRRGDDRLGVVAEIMTDPMTYLTLPKKDEIDREETRWRPWIRRLADEAGFIFIDLSHDLRALSRDEAVALFIGEEDGDYIDAAGHYNERGHAWVADVLHTRLRGVPAVAARLAPSGGEE